MDRKEAEKATDCQYVGEPIPTENRARQNVSIRIKAGWGVFDQFRQIFLDRHLHVVPNINSLQSIVLPAMTYGFQTWSPTKARVKKLKTSQRSIERKLLYFKQKEIYHNTIITQKKKQQTNKKQNDRQLNT